MAIGSRERAYQQEPTGREGDRWPLVAGRGHISRNPLAGRWSLVAGSKSSTGTHKNIMCIN
jgi:hypothetical protein